MQQTVSIVVPVFNEAENIPLLFDQLDVVLTGIPQSFELVFVDDGSTDESVKILKTYEARDSRVRVIEFSRNFGKEIAVTAGIHAATGQAVIMLDADMQYPVDLIPEFIAKWQAGAEVVVGVRTRYGRESMQKKFNSWMFYKLFSLVADTPVTPHATDFRLLDRVVIDAFNQFSERNRITRGLIDWLGFKRDFIYFKSLDRLHGQANYSFSKLFSLAVNSFVGMSLFPLRLAGWIGLIITAFSGFLGLFMFIENILLHDPLGLNFSGPAMLAVLNMFWIGIILIALGLVALYIANIHAEVINRPLYVVRPSTAKKHSTKQ